MFRLISNMKRIRTLAAAFAFVTLTCQVTPAADSLHSSILQGTQGALIRAGKTAAPATAITGKKFLFIYFSAHWCPPCRAFTPKLVEFYNQNRSRGDFELLFVSSDKSQEKMDEYMSETKMPWLGLRLDNGRTQALKQQYEVRGIPCLVLLDEKDRVLASSFQGQKYIGPDAALKKYASLHGK